MSASLPPPVSPLDVNPARRVQARRCARHPDREAVARCPDCGGAFCRECVSEHAGRVLCASCLARATANAALPNRPRRNLARIRRAAVPFAGFLLLWWAFYGLGALLLKIPPDFHEGTIWRRLEGEGQP